MKDFSSLLNLWDFESSAYKINFKFNKNENNLYNLSQDKENFILFIESHFPKTTIEVDIKESTKIIELEICMKVFDKLSFLSGILHSFFKVYEKKSYSSPEIKNIYYKYKKFEYPLSANFETIVLDLLNEYFPSHDKKIYPIVASHLEHLCYNYLLNKELENN